MSKTAPAPAKATEVAETPKSENTETTGALKYTGDNPMFVQMFETLSNLVSQYGDKNTVLKASTEGRDSAIESFVKTSNDPEAVKLRDGIAKLNAKLRELAEQNVSTTTLSEDQQTEMRKEVDGLRGQIRTGVQAARGAMPFVAPTGDEHADKFLDRVDEMIRAPRGRAPGSKLSGDQLPRTNVIVHLSGGSLPADGVTFETMSHAAKRINMELKDFQLAFAEAAGVEHSEIGSVKTAQEFTVKPSDNENSSVYTVKTEPKAVQKPGRKPKSETTANATAA